LFYLKKDKIKVNKKKKLFFDDFSFFFSQKFGELIKSKNIFKKKIIKKKNCFNKNLLILEITIYI
jgi:hypothetical protein